MLDDFINQTLDFLKKSDIRLDYPEIRHVKIEPDGRRTISTGSYCCTGAAEIRENLVMVITILFSLLDMLVDKRFPECEGKNLRKRYKELPDSTDYERIFKELFRIMRVFRNAIVHSKTSVCRSADHFDITSRNCSLTITRSSLELALSLIVHFARKPDSPYITAIFRQYYDDILGGITSFSDDICCPFRVIEDGLRLRRTCRYRIENPKYQFDNDNRVLTMTRFVIPDCQKRWSGAEYYVSIDETPYLIPDEALNESGEITRATMDPWVYDARRFF